jgi:hypothetical protein
MMQRLLNIFLLLLLITNNAYAEWVLYGSTENGSVTFYDRLTIKRNGNKVKVWTYINTSPNDEKAKYFVMSSARTLSEIDCVNETSMRLALHFFPKYDLEGGMTDYTEPNPKIDYIVPDSTHAALMKLVCKK